MPYQSQLKSALNGTRTYSVFTPNLDQFHGEYKDLAAANPYAHPDYKQSWWQKTLSNLGFRTNYDSYLEGMNLQAKEYENSLLLKQRDEDYDSPLQQAEREREAGLNPNLTGNVSAGESAPLRDDGNPPVPPEADDLGLVQGFASTVLQGVQAAFGLAGSIQNLRSVRLDNESKTMQMVKSAWNMIIPDIYENRNDWESGRIDVNNYYNSLHKQFGHTMSKKQFGDFVNRVNQFANSAEGWKMVYDTQTQKAKARKSMFEQFAGESYSEWDDIMQVIGDSLGNLAFEVNKTGLENQKEFNGNYDAATAAKLQSSPDDLQMKHNQRIMSDYQVSLRNSFKTIMDKLDGLSDKGNHIAPIVKAVLSAWLLGMIPGVPGSK